MTEPQQSSVISASAADITDADAIVEEESLVEEVSIDGMCGVY
ncbi:MAG TPA: mycofactocin precursor MftA [Pseudolysinimonas sp.]|nr:mycofactocin precursor MftA [Pseudolysinimonas sp.]